MPDQMSLELEGVTCEICESDISECECPTCNNCEQRRSENDICGNCSVCVDCCECFTCARCDARVESICSHCERCSDCCNCETCDNCGDRVEGTCDNCHNCSDCCECYYCEGCDARVRDTCGDCDRCNDCCDCGGRVSTYEGELTFHRAERNQYVTNTSRRFISLELEVSRGDSAYMHNVAERWNDSIVEDGSLPDTGWEMNLNPSQGDIFIRHTNDVARSLRTADANVNTTCGMHCHIDARDLGWFDLFKLCRLYARIEDGLFRLVSRSRQNNHYCGRCATDYTFDDFRSFKGELLYRLYHWRSAPGKKTHCALTYSDKKHKGSHEGQSRKVFSERREKHNGARYRGLNLHSFFYRGTVEFRHHHGTIDAARMQGWGMVCANIIDAASRLTVAEIDSLPNDSFDALLAILPESLQMWTRNRAESLLKRGE